MFDFLSRFTLSLYTPELMQECEPFSCGVDEDMDEFFKQDVHQFSQFHMGKSYCFRPVENPKQIAAVFTVSNDSIRLFDLGSSKKNKMWKEISNREKMLSRYPGILIGRFAVSKNFARQGIGSSVLKFIKEWFLEPGNKTGCRLAIVDAKNEPGVLDFYSKNGFHFLFSTEQEEDLYMKAPKTEEEKVERMRHPARISTRLMYCDLLPMG